MIYCYARVSTEDQNLDRQIVEFEKYKPYVLYQDKQSGKDFERTNYQRMRKKLKEGDTLIVLSLDRFGRNYDQIKQEWQYLCTKGIKIKILDMPVLDTSKDDLTSKLISDIVLNLLSYVAQMERENILKRQAQGIAAAKARGVKFGRPRVILPSNFDEVGLMYKNGEITASEAGDILNLSSGTLFRYFHERDYLNGRKYLNKNINTRKNKHIIYECYYCDKVKTFNKEELLEELNVSYYTLLNHLKGLGNTIIDRMGIRIVKKEI